MTLDEFIKKHNINDFSAGTFVRLKIHYAVMAERITPLSEKAKIKKNAIADMLQKIFTATHAALEDFKKIED